MKLNYYYSTVSGFRELTIFQAQVSPTIALIFLAQNFQIIPLTFLKKPCCNWDIDLSTLVVVELQGILLVIKKVNRHSFQLKPFKMPTSAVSLRFFLRFSFSFVYGSL